METKNIILELRTQRGMSQDELIDVCAKNMVSGNFTEEQARSYLREMLPKLDYWKRYEELSDNGQFEAFKQTLIKEINDLQIEGIPKVEKLYALVGKQVNLEYNIRKDNMPKGDGRVKRNVSRKETDDRG